MTSAMASKGGCDLGEHTLKDGTFQRERVREWELVGGVAGRFGGGTCARNKWQPILSKRESAKIRTTEGTF